MRSNKKILSVILFLILFSVYFQAGFLAQEPPKKSLTFQDIMKFKEIYTPIISEDGKWVAYEARPGIGDSEVKINGIDNNETYAFERGHRPIISKNSKWAAVLIKPQSYGIKKSEKAKLKQEMALVNLETGNNQRFPRVQKFMFSDDSRWIVYHLFKEETKTGEKKKEEKKEGEEEPEKPKKKGKSGTSLVLLNLETDEEIQIPLVMEFAFDSDSKFLAYVVAESEGDDNGLYYVGLSREGWSRNSITKTEFGEYSDLTWSREGSILAFLSGTGEEGEKGQLGALWTWDGIKGKLNQSIAVEDVPKGWFIPLKNSLEWSRDGQRIFFGLKPSEFIEKKSEEKKKKEEEIIKEEDLYNEDKLLEKRGVDVWHWNDPFINSHQKINWPRLKNKTYKTVFSLSSGRFIQLEDKTIPNVSSLDNPNYVLGTTDIPYRKEVTWDGRYSDIYRIRLKNGARQKVVSRLEGRPSLSPDGRYIAFYQNKHWYLYDGRNNKTLNLTKDFDIPFYNEDYDYPSAPPGYGVAGWVESDQAILIYDKYDIWHFSTRTRKATNLTGGVGRDLNMTFRNIRLDSEKRFFTDSESLLLSSYHNLDKNYGFYRARIGNTGVEKLIEENKRFRFLAKAKNSDSLIFTRESYAEFPDIWITSQGFSDPKKISLANPQIDEFAWGTAELVKWSSVDGIPLQGVLIKPGNYIPGKKYPVFVYYYRFFSQRLHEFNQIVINHRPCFPFYASNGYAVFLPDIRFDVGNPGYAATKCLVPGVQKLIDMGIADPDAIGLHGHSWSGYQTAFVITQTNIFTAAIAGAPVSNMTSAYSGIRWGSGLARQFQYEKSQSRIGGSLWEKLELYIENSPVFYADRINTPLLIMFGDKDGAVPWYQGIELYLAMRRLEKDCVFLQYRGEPHHPQKYANKLDYSIKMKQYFDHYLKKITAPDWITKGVLYNGK